MTLRSRQTPNQPKNNVAACFGLTTRTLGLRRVEGGDFNISKLRGNNVPTKKEGWIPGSHPTPTAANPEIIPQQNPEVTPFQNSTPADRKDSQAPGREVSVRFRVLTTPERQLYYPDCKVNGRGVTCLVRQHPRVVGFSNRARAGGEIK